ncbi:sulfite exporter TauE/SafE family protein [Legionella spiritensis]|uniref:Probable membrane transporter protein n=1 Tax=Legionella spiritensis TaxID=452 RepID=A0A0W0YZG9_LEGSP|nr:sulfite exporter TauE/SafE family protein [Legionella spiritensis]KTD62265.1 permease [Legionella spiritensis]SNV28641.1 permease [Legionella spiritensis]
MIIHEIITNGTIYAMAGAFAGLMSGILGIGGGIVVVPALLYIFQHNSEIPPLLAMHFAAGTSLGVMIFTSQASVRSHYKLGEILWKVYQRLWPGIVVGVIVGAFVASLIPIFWLQLLFGLFLLFVAFKMLLELKVTRTGKFPRTWVNTLVSLVIGFKSGLLGVGGGTLIIPYLTFCGVPTRKIPAVSALCTMTVAVLGTLVFYWTGSQESGLPSYATGYVYWPAVLWVAIPSVLFAPMGAKLNYHLPVKQLRYGFIIVLVCTAIDLLI